MTAMDIAMAFVGFIICALIVAVVGILIMLVIWNAFKAGIDIEEWEEL